MKSLLDKMFPSSIDAITPMIRREREMYHEEKAKSDRRLALLRRWNKDRVKKGYPCSFCGAAVHGITRDGKHELVDNHADGCELAEEIGDD